MKLSMRNFLFQVLMILTVMTAGIAHAQLRVVITEGQVAPTPIAIADFTGPDGEVTEIGRQMSAIISNDLESSGLFQPIDSAAFISPPKRHPFGLIFLTGHLLGQRGCLWVRPIPMKTVCFRSNLCCGML